MSAQVIIMTPPDPQELAWYPTSDLGNARRLQARARGLLRWVDQGEQAGYWIGYEDGRWSRRTGERQARLLADEVADCLREEAKALAAQIEARRIPDSMPEEIARERLTELRKWALKSGNAAQTEGMLKKAKPIMAIGEGDFDHDPYAFNVRNGTLRFIPPSGAGREPSGSLGFRAATRDGQSALRPCGPGETDCWRVVLDPHDPADMMTRMAEVEYDPDAKCPLWLARLEELQPEEDQREMFRRIMGYAMLGVRSEQKFVVAQGRGGDGKSASFVALSEIFGDYYRHADVQSFLKGGTKSGSDHSEDLARLTGDTRFVTCDEPERGSTWNSKVLKQMTSGGKMTVRALRASSVEVTPRWLLVVECNPFPRVPTSDEGFWRRCLPFQWPVQLTPAQQAQQPFDVLKAALLGERNGILNWMIGGALDWLTQRDLKPSARSKEVKENYRNTSDPFSEWYRTRCVTGSPTDPGLKEKGADLHADFKTFCEDELGIDSAKVPGLRAFGTQLDERQHPNRKSNGNKVRFGIRLKTDQERWAEEMAEQDGAGGAAADGFVPPEYDL